MVGKIPKTTSHGLSCVGICIQIIYNLFFRQLSLICYIKHSSGSTPIQLLLFRYNGLSDTFGCAWDFRSLHRFGGDNDVLELVLGDGLDGVGICT
jgi:hypothetical protein